MRVFLSIIVLFSLMFELGQMRPRAAHRGDITPYNHHLRRLVRRGIDEARRAKRDQCEQQCSAFFESARFDQCSEAATSILSDDPSDSISSSKFCGGTSVGGLNCQALLPDAFSCISNYCGGSGVSDFNHIMPG